MLAIEWEQRYEDNWREGDEEVANAYWFCVETLRVTIAAHLTPETKVRYIYANQWRTGVLLTRPNKDNSCWQVRRNGFGGWVDQVQQGIGTMRICVETREKDK